MSLTYKKIAVVGSREFKNWQQLKETVDQFRSPVDHIISGGAAGADSFAQRYVKEKGGIITIHYPIWQTERGFDKGAGFARNKDIAEDSDIVLAFYRKGFYQQGGTRNTIDWSIKLGKQYKEFEED